MLVDAGGISNFGSIDIFGGSGVAGGTLDAAAGAFLGNNGQISGIGILLNEGVINADLNSGVAFTADLTFVSAGTLVDRSFEPLIVAGAITTDPGKAGRVEIINQSTLALYGSIDAGQAIQFDADRQELEIGNLPDFDATLSGLANSDVIDFLGQDLVKALAKGDLLTVTVASGASYTLVLAAPLTDLGFSLTSDGNGGTDMTFFTKT